MRRFLVPLASAGFALALSGVAVAPAQAAEGHNLFHAATQKCLDGSLSQGLRLATCNGSTYQQWSYRGTFLHIQSGKCLDYSVSQGLRLVTCNNDSDYQRWGWGGDSRILHGLTGKCLDGSLSQGVRMNTCNTSDYQRWL